MCFDISHATQLFFGVICMIPFMYIIIVYLVFISSIAKGLAMSQLGGDHVSVWNH